MRTRTIQASGPVGGEPLSDGAVVGAVRIFARAKDAFGPDAVRTGELFAGPAAVSVHNAQPAIDQALGILMSRTAASAAEAFGRLRLMWPSVSRSRRSR